MKKSKGWKEIPDGLWEILKRRLPPEKPPKSNGRPVVPYRTVMNGILYKRRTGCQWQRLPQEYGRGSTCHARFQEWRQAGVFRKAWAACLRQYDDLQGLHWDWQSLDSVTVKAPKGGATRGPIPRIAGNGAPNGIISPIGRGSRWPPSSRPRTATT